MPFVSRSRCRRPAARRRRRQLQPFRLQRIILCLFHSTPSPAAGTMIPPSSSRSRVCAHEREVFENGTRGAIRRDVRRGHRGQAAAEGRSLGAPTVVRRCRELSGPQANVNFLSLQTELATTEYRLQTARRFYKANGGVQRARTAFRRTRASVLVEESVLRSRRVAPGDAVAEGQFRR